MTPPRRTPDPPTLVHKLCEAVVAPFLALVWRSNVVGLENVPREGRVIVAFNHRHWFDGVVCTVMTYRASRFPRWVGKEELFRNPLARWFLMEVGCVPLDRTRGDVQAIRWAVNVLESEGCLCLFPEGTRAREGKQLKAKPGISFLAQKTGAPVVPARVWGTEHWPKPVRMGVKFGKPMYFKGGDRAAAQAFADRVMDSVYSL